MCTAKAKCILMLLMSVIWILRRARDQMQYCSNKKKHYVTGKEAFLWLGRSLIKRSSLPPSKSKRKREVGEGDDTSPSMHLLRSSLFLTLGFGWDMNSSVSTCAWCEQETVTSQRIYRLWARRSLGYGQRSAPFQHCISSLAFLFDFWSNISLPPSLLDSY